MTDALRKIEISLFSVVVDVSIVSLQERFKILGEVERNFGVPVNFSDLPK